ncbi:SURF1 family cytochrome oxidase biogenesis protein [Sphingomonas flavalba]|uniref:SURF1 family cytochrome oxidase biogenesis protein n=1 Tax=Sphingomonas flavalba TaxID=2559804 RepID=UPI0039E066A8
MKRLPLIPTVIVALAVALMIGLGIWQLQRAQWKAALLATYAAAHDQPPVAYPTVPDPRNAPLFRRSSALCVEVVGWRSTSGRNLAGVPGWSHIAQCRRGAEGPGFQAVMGWSDRPDDPAWTGGPVTGVIAPDSQHVIRLVASEPAPGLQAAAAPSPEDIPNNHLSYAVQWFLFAGVAMIIYGLALRRRG